MSDLVISNGKLEKSKKDEELHAKVQKSPSKGIPKNAHCRHVY
jgi:hypothetical protein